MKRFIDLERYLTIGNIANCTPPLHRALFLVRLLLFLRYLKMVLRISLRTGDVLFLSYPSVIYFSYLIYRVISVSDRSFFNQVGIIPPS